MGDPHRGWDVAQAGYLEADSVALGRESADEFIWSLTYTDLASTRTDGRALWND